MQELVLALGSVAGACTAVVISKFPIKKSKRFVSTNSRIKEQIESLKMEKEILTKTISRLYDKKSEISTIQREKLLLNYQHQLGLVITKIEKLEAANKHPDLGPLGDGLVTLLDQKLSHLENKLSELSSKISLTNESQMRPIEKSVNDVKKIEQNKIKNIETSPKFPNIDIFTPPPSIDIKPEQPHRPVEITTLTQLPSKISDQELKKIEPAFFKKPIIDEALEQSLPKHHEKVEIVQSTIGKPTLEKPIEIPTEIQTLPIEKKPEPILDIPDDDNDEDDDNDLSKIKSEIAKTLSRLEQAEVE